MVAMHVVDGLETVDIDIEQPQVAAITLGVPDGLLQTVVEKAAIGKTGERVVGRLFPQGSARLLPFAQLGVDLCAIQPGLA